MGLFGKSRHKKEVDAGFKILANLYSKTTEGGADAPLVLNFERPDSHFRYFIFCLSTMHKSCANRMSNPDAVLNELMHDIITTTIKADPILFFGSNIGVQTVANKGSEYIQDYLNRWSAYVDIVEGGNNSAATTIVCSMLRDIESSSEPSEEDTQRLWPLAVWIEESLDAMAGAFLNMT